MKLLGFVILLTFLVSTFAVPLVRDDDVPEVIMDESVEGMDENGIKDLRLDELDAALEIQDNGIKDLWNKFKKAVKDYAGGRAAELRKLVIKYKPRIHEELEKLKKTLVYEVKNIAIEFLTDIMKIIMVTEDGVQHVVEIPIKALADEPDQALMEVDSKISDWFKKVWEKIQAFFTKMGIDIVIFFDKLAEQIKQTFELILPADVRAKIAAALKQFGQKILAKLEETFDRYKDLIIAALKKDGKVIVEEGEKLLSNVVETIAKFITDAIKKIIGGKMNDEAMNDEMMNDDVDVADNGIKEFWEKVKAAVTKYFVGRFEEFKKLGKKYDTPFEDFLTKFEKDLFQDAKVLGIDFLGDIIKIISGIDPFNGVMNDDVDVADNGIKEFWEKVKAAVTKYFVGRFEEFKKMEEKHKQQIIHFLKTFGSKLWYSLRSMAVDFLGDIIKIISGIDPFSYAGFNDEEMELSSVDSKIGDWFKKVWAQIKAFFEHSGQQIKTFFDELGKKIKETFEQIFPAEVRAKIIATLKKFGKTILAKLEETFDKYKDAIIAALKKDGKVIVEEGEKLLASVVETIAKFITDAIKKIIGYKELMMNDDVDVADNGIKEFWEKVVEAVTKYFVGRFEEFKKLGEKYDAPFEAFLKKFENDLFHDVKVLGIDFLSDIIKIISGIDPFNGADLNDEEMELSAVDSKIGDWFKKVWAQIKAFFEHSGQQIKTFFEELGKKIKETFEQIFSAEVRAKIVAALKKFGDMILSKLDAIWNKYKDLIIAALKKDGKVIVEEAEKLLTSVVETIAKFITDAIKKIIGGKLNDEVVFDAFEDLKELAELESIADCVKAEKECMTASTGLQKLKCLLDLATCVGGETAKCAQKCGVPVVKCVRDAVFQGKIGAITKCFQEFIKCAKDCAKQTQ